MKKAIIIILVLAAGAFTAYALISNKEEMKKEAELADVKSRFIPVESVVMEPSSSSSEVSASGTFNAASDLSVISETQGKVESIFRQKGDRVAKGNKLAQIESDLLQAEVAAAQSNYDKLKTDLDRFTSLADKGAVTKRQLEDIEIGLKNADAQLRSAKKRLENTAIRATTNGVIDEDYIQEGTYVSPGMKLFDIVDVSKLKLNVDLTAEQVLKVKEGDTTSVSVRVYPEKEFMAKVLSVSSKANSSLKYDVELMMRNESEFPMKAGMYATANFNFHSTDDRLFVNRDALFGSLQNPEVFIIEDSLAQLKPIVIGQVIDDRVEVLEGLNQGDEVILTGQINLENGTKVKVINR